MIRFYSTLFALLWIAFGSVNATDRQTAYKLYNRLAGVPPEAATLNQLEQLIRNGQIEEAAELSLQSPYFYNVTLKNWVKSWSNVEQSNRVPLNDYVATVVGMIRDDIPFDTVLYGDHLYVLQNGNIANYSPSSNAHYEQGENGSLDLSSPSILVRRSQSSLNGISDTAGVLTTRASGEAYLSAGTNRRLTRFTFMNFLCRDFENVMDTTTPDFYVRRDVERDPGGDSRTYRNNCVGCHAGQDALGGAFAYFDFRDGRVIHQPGTVQEKINRNNLFEEGHIVTNNEWHNLWSMGQNSSLGWRGDQRGQGARELGRMIAQSQAFSQCMTTRVWELVCLNPPVDEAAQQAIQTLSTEFEQQNNYNMKRLFARVSAHCIGGASL